MEVSLARATVCELPPGDATPLVLEQAAVTVWTMRSCFRSIQRRNWPQNNRPCIAAYDKQYRLEHRERQARARATEQIAKLCALTPIVVVFEAVLTTQRGACLIWGDTTSSPICGSLPRYGVVRGLLCRLCNCRARPYSRGSDSTTARDSESAGLTVGRLTPGAYGLHEPFHRQRRLHTFAASTDFASPPAA